MKIKEDGNEIRRIVAACNNASIPEDVEEIGQNAFEGVYAFAEALGRVKVENLVLPEGLKVILPNAFSACRDLVSVELPSTLTRIDDGAFNNDDNITSVIVKAKEPFTIAENTFSSIANVTLYVPAGCKAAYQAADVWKGFKEIVESEDGEVFTAKTIEGVEMTFQVISKADKTCQVGVSGKEEICFDSNYNGQLTIPAKANGYDVISIAPFACSGSRVTSIIVSEGIKTIEDRAFGFNGSMESITLPEGLETIGSNIVWSCGSLKSFHVPSTVTEMHTTFGWCDALEEITVAEGNEVFDSRNNCNAIIKTKTNELLAGCKNTVIPNTVEILAASSFTFLKSLTEITIPEGVKVMRNQIFAKTSLKSITIPSTMTTIGSFSFDGCEDLTEVTIKCAKPFVIKDDVFTDVAYGGVLNVPFGTKSLYEGTDGWKNFKNIVEMESSEEQNDGEVFTAKTIEGVEMTFQVISETDKTCQVGTGKPEEPAVDKTYEGAVTIPAEANGFKVTTVGKYAFWGTNITSIVISEGLEFIENSCFRRCQYLKTIELPSTLKSIGEHQLAVYLNDVPEENQTNVNSVISHIIEPFNISETAFGTYDDGTGAGDWGDTGTAGDEGSLTRGTRYAWNSYATLYVPFGTIDKYKAIKGWTMFKEIIEMEDSDDDLNTVLTLEAVEDGTTITISNPLKLTIGYSLDGGNNWNTSDAESITISGFAAGTKVCLHGDNDQYSDLNNYTTINCDKDCYLYGNIMSLISSTDFAKITELTKESTFAYLFSENTHIKNHPSKNIVLPATTLSDYCYALLFYNCTSLTRPAVLPATSIPNGAYYGLFSGCSSLKEAPALPATVLDEYSYAWMFENCTSLTTAPALPASSVPEWAYRSMFLNCTNLTETPSLPATTIAKGSYAWMFESCESLTKAPEILPASVAADSCYYAMFAVCKSLTTAPKLPATKLGESCYAWMFNECEALVSAPDLPATEMADSCYIGMFRCCDALTTAPKLPATKLAHNCYAAMFFHSGLKEVPELPAVNLAERCYGYMFSQCPNITSAVLPAAKLEKDCYEAMFQYCENLNSVTCMATDISAEGCCRIWLDGVAETGTFTKPNSMTAWETGVSGIPESWTIDNMRENTEAISISKALQVTYMSDKNLDFTGYPDLKAYVATGYDKASGTIWLTRVKYVPANTGILLMGEAGDYEIPVKKGESTSYYMNLFKGTIEGTTIQTTDGDNTNYYLSKGDAGVGFYKVQGSVELKPNRAYLSVPTEIPVVGATGSTETIKVSAAGQVPYYNSQSLDFSSLDAQGVKAYTATGYDYSTGTIWLTRVKQVPAETGILIMAPQGEYPVPTASVASVYANMFKGTLTGTTIQTHETIAGEDYINYYLSKGESGVGFYKVTKEEGVTIGANRCYLPILNKDAAAGTRSANSDQNQIAIEEADEVIGIPLLRGIGGDEDGTTGVKEVKSEGVKSEEWYTLQGQRVAKPGKGLYIRNGKVVVIK